MRKRLCAALLSCMMLFTGIPVSASEGEYTDFSEDITLESEEEEGTVALQEVDEANPDIETVQEQSTDEDASHELTEVPEDVELSETTDIPEDTAITEESAVLPDDRESAWLERYNLTKTEDGNYISVDENGDTWLYYADDPELFKYFPIEDTEREIIPFFTQDEEGYSFESVGGNTDPHVFKLSPDRKYAYPQYYKTDDDSKRVGIHYGIDISYHQQKISVESFARMKRDYGIEFVIVRSGLRGYGVDGKLKDDYCFGNNVTNAAAAGLKVGAYFFSQAITEKEAEEEAELCLKEIAPYRKYIELPVYIDYEYSGSPGRLKAAGLSAREHTAIVNRFCSIIKSNKYLTGVYADTSMLNNDMVISDIPSTTYIWMAQYPPKNKDGVYECSYTKRLETWQFTSGYTGFSSGMVATDTVDVDFWFGDYYRIADSLKYEANGGRGSMSVTKGYQGTEVTVANCSYNNAGHTFVEWNTKADGTGTPYEDGEKVNIEEDLTLYAQWTTDITALIAAAEVKDGVVEIELGENTY